MNNFTSFAGFSWISHWLIERRKVSLDYFDNLQYNLHIVTIEWQGPGKIYAPAEETHTGRGQLPSRTAFFTIGTVEGVANDFERFERSWNGLSLCWTSPLAFVNFFVILDLEGFKDFWVCKKLAWSFRGFGQRLIRHSTKSGLKWWPCLSVDQLSIYQHLPISRVASSTLR